MTQKMRITLLCAVTTAALAACNTAPPAALASPPAAPAVDTGKIADAVKADVTQLVAELNARDVDKAVAHDAADMVGMFHGTVVENGNWLVGYTSRDGVVWKIAWNVVSDTGPAPAAAK